MPTNPKRYKVRVRFQDACSVIPEQRLKELALSGIDKWRKGGVPSHVMLPPLVEFWNAHHRVKLDLVLDEEEGESDKRSSRAG